LWISILLTFRQITGMLQIHTEVIAPGLPVSYGEQMKTDNARYKANRNKNLKCY
jgi:hypothetical protein